MLDHTLRIWLPLNEHEDKWECIEVNMDRQRVITAVNYLSSKRVPCEATRETVEVISADYAELTPPVRE